MRTKLLVKLGILFLVAVPINCPAQENEPRGNFVQGMNIVHPTQRSVAEQDELIAQLQQNRIHVVRCSINPAGKEIDGKYIDFAKRLYAAGIEMDLILHLEYPPNAPMRPANTGHPRIPAPASLSDASVALSKRSFESMFGQLDANGVKVAAFELGNEINWTDFNGEFPFPGEGRTFELQDLSNDPEAKQIAKGFLEYLKVLAALKDVRDRSRVNRHAPIISAGLAFSERRPPREKEDVVSINSTLQFLRQHGSDNLVDAYGVHFYPDGGSQGGAISAAGIRSSLEKDIVAECGKPKPCWITEWGFNNHDMSCPVNDDKRAALVQ